MRTAVIAVMAVNRLIKFTCIPGQRPLSGVPLRIGRESFVLASPTIISHAKGNKKTKNKNKKTPYK